MAVDVATDAAISAFEACDEGRSQAAALSYTANLALAQGGWTSGQVDEIMAPALAAQAMAEEQCIYAESLGYAVECAYIAMTRADAAATTTTFSPTFSPTRLPTSAPTSAPTRPPTLWYPPTTSPTAVPGFNTDPGYTNPDVYDSAPTDAPPSGNSTQGQDCAGAVSACAGVDAGYMGSTATSIASIDQECYEAVTSLDIPPAITTAGQCGDTNSASDVSTTCATAVLAFVRSPACGLFSASGGSAAPVYTCQSAGSTSTPSAGSASSGNDPVVVGAPADLCAVYNQALAAAHQQDYPGSAQGPRFQAQTCRAITNGDGAPCVYYETMGSAATCTASRRSRRGQDCSGAVSACAGVDAGYMGSTATSINQECYEAATSLDIPDAITTAGQCGDVNSASDVSTTCSIALLAFVRSPACGLTIVHPNQPGSGGAVDCSVHTSQAACQVASRCNWAVEASGNSDDDDSGASVGMIIGIVAGVVFLCGVGGLVAFFVMQQNSDDNQKGAGSGALDYSSPITNVPARAVQNPVYGGAAVEGDGYLHVDADVAVGDRVSVEGKGAGVVRFVGPHAENGKPRVGVELDDAVGKNNGTVKVWTCIALKAAATASCAASIEPAF